MDLTDLTRITNATAVDGIAAYKAADGSVVLRLDQAAAYRLRWLLDDIGPGYDLAVNPGFYGINALDAPRLDAVRYGITGPIARALPSDYTL
jgi:hypothetical protein